MLWGLAHRTRDAAESTSARVEAPDSARFKLAGAAPAKVLADMIGLTVATAIPVPPASPAAAGL